MAIESYNVFDVVTPSNTADLTGGLTDALWIGGAGNLAVQGQNGVTRTITGVTAGALIPIKARRVLSTGTTATSIVALYQS